MGRPSPVIHEGPTTRPVHDRDGLYDCDDPDCGGSPDCDESGDGGGGDGGGGSSATRCADTCVWAHDGACDDGGAGSSYDVCYVGTDCADCGSR